MSDLISRADAIEALGEEPEVWTDTEEEWAYRNAWVEHISALKALPSATCDDCIWHVCNYNKIDWDGEDGYISRQDAICEVLVNDGTDNIVDRINALPSAEPKTWEWIPVSDRLPKARESVILSTKEWTGEGCHWETTKHHVIWKGYGWNATYWDDEVIAWMPLPEPYREDGEA